MDAPLLVVDPDPVRRGALERGARAADLEVVVASTAKNGLELANAVEPGCAVIELELPDHDGIWLTTALRATPAIAVTPVVLVASVEDIGSRALRSGVDVLLQRPIDVRLLLAQVDALAAMARRIRDRKAVSSMLRRTSEETPGSLERGAPFGGDLATLPAATVLTILELDRRSGVLELRAPGRTTLSLDVVSGFVNGATLGARSLDAAAAVREAIAFKKGCFELFAGPSRPAPPGLWPTTRHLLAAVEGQDGKASVAPPPPAAEASASPAPPRPSPSTRKITLSSSRAVVPAPDPKGATSELVRVAGAPTNAPKKP